MGIRQQTRDSERLRAARTKACAALATSEAEGAGVSFDGFSYNFTILIGERERIDDDARSWKTPAR